MIDASPAVHAALGSWAIEYKLLLSPTAFDELERRVMALVEAECAYERAHCATLAEVMGSPRIAAAIRGRQEG